MKSLSLKIGIYDALEEQDQDYYSFDLYQSHLAIFGGAMSGKTTILKTILIRIHQLLTNYEEEIYDLKQEIEYLRSVGSLVILDKKCKKLQDRIDKAVEYNKEIIKALLSCCSYEKDKVEDMLYEQQNILESKGE